MIQNVRFNHCVSIIAYSNNRCPFIQSAIFLIAVQNYTGVLRDASLVKYVQLSFVNDIRQLNSVISHFLNSHGKMTYTTFSLTHTLVLIVFASILFSDSICIILLNHTMTKHRICDGTWSIILYDALSLFHFIR